ncbi:MAG: alcohol dehydrogenase catalytic domain-containing protein [Acidimicrobiales bacterium]|jgi:threonine dehydrogenase-like Zn-dependent dehydrogenase
MRASVTAEGHELRVTDVEEPLGGERQLLLHVDFAGICGSDLHFLDILLPSVVLGHEFTGTVEAIGPGVEGFAIGDRICAVPSRSLAVTTAFSVFRATPTTARARGS